MDTTEQAGRGHSRGRNVGLWFPPEDYARLEQWAQARHRKVANAARTIILERLEADELAERTELADEAEQREYERTERIGSD